MKNDRKSVSFNFLAFLIALFLVGCGTMPVSSVYKLRNFDIKTTNLAKFYAAVRIPQSLAPRENGVTIDLGFASKKAGIKFSERIVLQQINAIPSIALDAARQPGFQIYVFKLNDKDAQKMRLTRERISLLRKKHDDGKGSISIEAKTCKRSAIPDGPLYLSTYLKSAGLEDFVVLVNNANIKNLGDLEKSLGEIPFC